MNEITIDGKSYTPDEVQSIMALGMKAAGIVQQGEKNDNFSTSGWMQAPHGYWGDGTTAGLFTRPGVEPDVFNAIRYPEAALISRLYAGTTEYEATEYEIMTGVDAGRGSNATDYCGPAPKAGWARLCTQRTQFGDFYMSTDRINVANNGGRINRGDVDRRIVGNPAGYPFLPQVGYNDINTTLGLEFFRFGIHVTRVMAQVLFTGSSANTGGNAKLGFIREFNGFDQLIKEGHVDIESGLFCKAADSIVANYNNVNVSSGTSNIVTQIATTYRQLRTRSDQNGFGGMWEGFLAMTPDMFYALTAVWPCNYLTNGCVVTDGSGQRLNVDSAQQISMRDEMRTGSFLWVDGERLQVYTTRAITDATQGPGFAGTVYFINDSVMGTRTTYIEAFNMSNPSNTQLMSLLPGGTVRFLNGGLYATTHTHEGFCIEVLFAARPRLVMRTPWLNARIENVVYVLDGYTDSPYPENSQYYVNGGRYTSEGPSIYS